MGTAGITVLVVLVAVIALLFSEKLRPDLVAVMALAYLMIAGILAPAEAFSGFASPATITIACMFILSAGLQSTGVVQYLGDRLLRRGPTGEMGLLLLMALVIGPASAFVNNTAAVAVFLPVALRASHGSNVSPSRVLMPLSFVAILGGTCTLIGTSTNILVSALAEEHGLRPFGMFEFSRLGLVLFGVGLLYLALGGRRLLPERVKADESLTSGHHLTEYLSEVVLQDDSPLVGRTLLESRLGERFDLLVLALIRAGRVIGAPQPAERLQSGDILLIKAPAATLLRLCDTAGITVRPGRRPADAHLRSADSALMEAVIAPNSALEGRTIKGVDFRNRYGATALAIRRPGEDFVGKIGHVRLQFGDEMLILVHRKNLDRLKRQEDFVVLQELEVPIMQPRRAAMAGLIVAGVVLTAAFGVFPIAVSAVVGSVLMVLTRCLPVRKVYGSIEWPVIVLLGGVIPLGMALESTGAADAAVHGLLWLLHGWGPQAVLGAVFLLTFLLTGFMSNAATAAVLVPVAISAAHGLNVDPRPFLVAVAFAASAAFFTPIGYQTNLLVYGPGGYRFSDYLKTGGPLNILYWLLATLLIPIFFPF